MHNSLLVRLSEPRDIPYLNQFRAVEFAKSQEFELINIDLLNTVQGDTLIVEMLTSNEKRIVSAMQIELFETKAGFINNYSPYYALDDIPAVYPSIYISKVATESSLRKLGLNSYLRLQALKSYTATSHGINSLTGIVFEGAPRIRLMKDLGYKSLQIQQKPAVYFKPFVPCNFMWLIKQDFQKAVTILESEVSQLQATYKIHSIGAKF